MSIADNLIGENASKPTLGKFYIYIFTGLYQEEFRRLFGVELQLFVDYTKFQFDITAFDRWLGKREGTLEDKLNEEYGIYASVLVYSIFCYSYLTRMQIERTYHQIESQAKSLIHDWPYGRQFADFQAGKRRVRPAADVDSVQVYEIMFHDSAKPLKVQGFNALHAYAIVAERYNMTAKEVFDDVVSCKCKS